MSNSCCHLRKSQRIIKVSRLYPVGTVNVCTKCNGNLLWISYGKTDTPSAMLLPWHKMKITYSCYTKIYQFIPGSRHCCFPWLFWIFFCNFFLPLLSLLWLIAVASSLTSVAATQLAAVSTNVTHRPTVKTNSTNKNIPNVIRSPQIHWSIYSVHREAREILFSCISCIFVCGVRAPHMRDITLHFVLESSQWKTSHLWNPIEQPFFQVFRGTITDAPDFDPSGDAETLYNAMKGIGECTASPQRLSTEPQRTSQRLWQRCSQWSVCVTEMKDAEKCCFVFLRKW